MVRINKLLGSVSTRERSVRRTQLTVEALESRIVPTTYLWIAPAPPPTFTAQNASNADNWIDADRNHGVPGAGDTGGRGNALRASLPGRFIKRLFLMIR
jgi:hypothetical protein